MEKPATRFENRYTVYFCIENINDGGVIGQAVIPNEAKDAARYTMRFYESEDGGILSFQEEGADRGPVDAEPHLHVPVGACQVLWNECEMQLASPKAARYICVEFTLPEKSKWLHAPKFLALEQKDPDIAPMLLVLYGKEHAKPNTYGVTQRPGGPAHLRSEEHVFTSVTADERLTGRVTTCRASNSYGRFLLAMVEHSDWALEKNCRV